MSALLSSKKSAYSKADDAASSREERLARLKTELREHIRFLSDYELLSSDWLRMAESMHQIANVAFMETSLPLVEDNPLQQSGKKGAGTLWDQEKDELAVRILLEEGKMNLVLRVLHKYKIAARQSDWRTVVKATADKYKSEEKTVLDRCRVFEQSVGILLKFVMQHIEALQIIDQPEFIVHASEVITHANTSTDEQLDGADADKMQPTLVIHYLASISGLFDELDEERIMDLIEENRLIPSLLAYLNAHYTQHSIATLMQAAYALNNLIASDPYQADRKRFVPTAVEQKQLVALKGLFVSELIAKYNMKKAGVQSLWDEMQRWEKTVGETKNVPLTVRGSGVDATNAAKPKEEHKEQ